MLDLTLPLCCSLSQMYPFCQFPGEAQKVIHKTFDFHLRQPYKMFDKNVCLELELEVTSDLDHSEIFC